MKITSLEIPDVKVVEPRVFADERGFFYESYHAPRYAEAGIHETFLQDNHSRSTRDTLRGLHYQSTPGQAKLVRVTRGAIYDVAVDIRRDSLTLGKWVGVELSEENRLQIFIPVGFAHGFVVRSELAEVQYKCSNVYDAETESGIAWDDPDLAVQWGVDHPLLSARDQGNESFAAYLARVRR